MDPHAVRSGTGDLDHGGVRERGEGARQPHVEVRRLAVDVGEVPKGKGHQRQSEQHQMSLAQVLRKPSVRAHTACGDRRNSVWTKVLEQPRSARRKPSGFFRGKSGHRRAGCWLTASRREPKESATENRPPAIEAGKGETER